MRQHATYNPPCVTELDILSQDESLLVVNKPAGLLAVPGRGADKSDSMISRVREKYPDALVVHRLDMDTSGLMLIARGAEMHRHLSGLFRERRVMKRYIAMVAGRIGSNAGEVELPLTVDWPNRPRQKVDFISGKPSLTRYRVSVDGTGRAAATRVELEPVTGRTHQLRLHMAAIGYPIMGDALYGQQNRGERLMLHASKLAFNHPRSGNRIEVTSAAPF